MEQKQIQEIFNQIFKENMIDKRIESFRRTHATLYYGVIIPAMMKCYLLGLKENKDGR